MGYERSFVGLSISLNHMRSLKFGKIQISGRHFRSYNALRSATGSQHLLLAEHGEQKSKLHPYPAPVSHALSLDEFPHFEFVIFFSDYISQSTLLNCHETK